MVEITQFLGASVPIFADGLGISIVMVIAFIIIVSGLALWKAARLKETAWFWVMVIFNTGGILPLIYLILKRNKTT